MITTIDPATGNPLEAYAFTPDHQLSTLLSRAVTAARRAAPPPVAARRPGRGKLHLGRLASPFSHSPHATCPLGVGLRRSFRYAKP